ncbi:hypothetical protein PRIPAC_77051 [Pristionchus pacificus]|nr:hypothetical protein PRIPAC_77051 [Pristionchus pacificus]
MESMRMPSFKLTSFKGRGRAEVAREMLFLGNVPYQEKRLAMDHWPSLRPGTPSGNVPELEANGKKLTQSFAIYRYLAQELGFAGSSHFEAAQIDSLAELHREYEEEIDSLMAVLFGFSDGDKEEMIKAIGEPARDKYFPILEDIAKKSGSAGHFIGGSLTWVDLLIAEHVSIMDHHCPGFLAYYPHVLKTTRKILDTPRLREWAKKRAENNLRI